MKTVFMYAVYGIKDGVKVLIGEFTDLNYVFELCAQEAYNYDMVEVI